jgi:hypothetical protein
MRIALLVRDLSRGGLARQVVYLARGLQARNHDVTIMELFGSEDWDDELEGTGIARERVGIRGHRDVLVLLQRTARRLRALEPEVI